MTLEALLGPALLKSKTKGDTVSTASVSANAKAIGLYFSAHWCPPCRQFTPMLAEIYKQLKETKGFEIVFISSDRDEHSFQEYFGEHPWLALPFEDRERKAALSSQFKVEGIPTLVILSATGELITTDGRTQVMTDPTGENFPWIPPTMAEALGNSFLNAEGAHVDASVFAEKVLGIYFSAHWCPPCQRFTPALVAVYNKLKSEGKAFEVIFVSSDKSQAEYDEYKSHMPWLSIPFGDKRKSQLNSLFQVEGIPSLIILDEKLTVINADATSVVASAGADGYPFRPPIASDVEEADPSALNSLPSVVVLMEDVDSDDQDIIKVTVQEVGEWCAQLDESAGKPRSFGFFYVTTANQIGQQIRRLAKLGNPTAQPQVVLLHLSDSGAYYTPANPHDVSGDAIRQLIDDFKANKLTRLQASR